MAAPKDSAENILACHECGASIYKEHLDQGLAGFRAGKLLCVYCLKERDKKPGAPRPSNEAPAPASAPAGPVNEADLPPISLVDELEMAESPQQRTSHGTAAGTAPPVEEPTKYTRPLNKTGAGATRCRTFHAKLADEAVRHMDLQINEWCEQHPEVEIKSSTSTVGLWTGKHAEPNLIITIFY